MNPSLPTMLLCLTLTAATTAACATDSGDWGAAPPGQEAALERGRFALLSLSASREAVRSENGVEVAAQFVEYAGPDADWAMQALDLWLPQPDANGWIDGCRLNLSAAADSTGGSAVPAHRIELLQAGQVTVAHNAQVELDVHYLPDLQVYLSGTVYSLDAGRLPYNAGRTYLLTGSGKNEVDMFASSVAAPAVMELLVVDGRPMGSVLEVPVPKDRDMLVEWREHDPDGVIYLDLYDDAGGASPLLSCVAVDDGRFRLPVDALERIRERHPEAALRLMARRADVTTFELSGFDWARIVFAMTDTVFLTLQ